MLAEGGPAAVTIEGVAVRQSDHGWPPESKLVSECVPISAIDLTELAARGSSLFAFFSNLTLPESQASSARAAAGTPA